MEQVRPLPLYDRIKLQERVDEAKSMRRLALTHLRFGNRFEHKLVMELTHLPLLLARQWKPK